MKLSDGERLIVVMLAEVMEELKLNKEVDPSLIKKLAYNGDDWAIKHRYTHLFESTSATPEVVSETINILWMWGIIEHSLESLEGEQEAEAKEWRYTKFSGFDGNNDPHHGVAHTLIRELGDFPEFKQRELNSHTQTSLPRYQRIHQKFDKYVQSGDAAPLSFDALRDICN